MKNSKFALLIVTLMFMCVLLGIYIGRTSVAKITVNAHPAEETATTDHIDYRLDINKATASELAKLPGIGETLAQRIIDYRQENGAFDSIVDLMLVEGIGSKKLNAIASRITVGG